MNRFSSFLLPLSIQVWFHSVMRNVDWLDYFSGVEIMSGTLIANEVA